MGHIYHAASRVLIWLGRAGEDSYLAMNIIPNIPSINLDNIPVDIEDGDTRKAWEALLQLCGRSWWTRSWILQEVAMASSDPLVICGNMSVPWSKFVIAGDLMSRSTSFRVLQTMPRTFNALSKIQQNTAYQSRIKLLLQETYTFEATNPSDKVYSLLGLAHKDDRVALQPDYSKSVKQLYTEVARYILHKDLNILCFNGNSTLHKLPSWVPDWSLSKRRWPLWMPFRYRASGASTAIIQPTSYISLLKVWGLLLDRISHFDAASRIDMSQSSDSDSTEREVLDNIESTLFKAIEENPSPEFRRLDPRNSDALWRTLVTDRFLIGRAHVMGDKSPPASFGTMYEVYRGRKQVPKGSSISSEFPFASQSEEEYIEPFRMSMQLGYQRFFVTPRGRIGLGPHKLRKDDVIVVLFGADMPFVLRSVRGCYRLLGPAYVHGLMNGEGLKFANEDELRQSLIDFNITYLLCVENVTLA